MPDVALADMFSERRDEIRSYLSFLSGVEEAVRSGVPRLGAAGPAISAQQQRILYSGVYLQLYNLVESTISGCLDAVSVTALAQVVRAPSDLSAKLRGEWVRHMAKTHREMGAERRLESVLALCEHLVSALPVGPFRIEKGGGGNWDDEEIYKIAARIGFDLNVSAEAQAAVKSKIRNDKGALALVVDLRNGLAHGRLSFVECSQDDNVDDLTRLANRVFVYLEEVVAAFERFIDDGLFLRADLRPVRAQA
ncbi:hypothetical protein J2800_000992 [Caulobacter rhizosphaerae]|uniref:MAE-28990/MAE-18760-like HEPN domain-containing protein n=1 Tax=Caulobacter rhizosphaerae TaxID=2010972 RepID=A0ABU1MVT0_9CAUL|nr:MAE_28990/MAE_18760 family HEPN-like nuclease [Caulobacter rhizosphaerae]MDR6530256.1 hypothetical protein [Caulobacter rhizosphaerae]